MYVRGIHIALGGDYDLRRGVPTSRFFVLRARESRIRGVVPLALHCALRPARQSRA